MNDAMRLKGEFDAWLTRGDRTIWRERFPNMVVIKGRDVLLDTALGGATAVGPYMGLISSTSWTGVTDADTMSSHSGWLEAGNANAPTYTGVRASTTWGSASGGIIALSAPVTFSITGTGIVKGCFLVFGSGAVSTIDSTAGALMSAGAFSSGDKTVGDGDTLNVSYSLTLS